MAESVNLDFKKNAYTSSQLSTLTSTPGVIVFDTNTKRIYVGQDNNIPAMFGSDIRDVTWNATTKILTISKIDSTTITLDFNENDANSILSSLKNATETNRVAIATLNGTGTGSVRKSIDDTIAALDSSAEIANINSDNIVSIRPNVLQDNAIIETDSDSDVIKLSPVAATGKGHDLSVVYNGNNEVVLDAAIEHITGRIVTLENKENVSYIVCQPNANDIPSGATYFEDSTGTSIVGRLAASSSTIGPIRLVKNEKNGVGSYDQYLTTGDRTVGYSWLFIGSTKPSMDGYVKSVDVNGVQYDPNRDGLITLNAILNSIVDNNTISNTQKGLVKTTVEYTTNNGTRTAELTSMAKVVEIENSDSNDGLALASEIKDYIASQQTIFKTWYNE